MLQPTTKDKNLHEKANHRVAYRFKPVHMESSEKKRIEEYLDKLNLINVERVAMESWGGVRKAMESR